MDKLNLFGFFVLLAMLIFYSLEKRSRWFILAFSITCLLAAVYAYFQGSWPFMLIEVVWAFVAFMRWLKVKVPFNV